MPSPLLTGGGRIEPHSLAMSEGEMDSNQGLPPLAGGLRGVHPKTASQLISRIRIRLSATYSVPSIALTSAGKEMDRSTTNLFTEQLYSKENAG